MKTTTINKLNNLAKTLSEKILSACKSGVLRQTASTADETSFESIKKTILKNAWVWHEICNIEWKVLSNIYKTTRQLNYLSNEVLYHLRKGGFFKECVPTGKYVQQTFNF